MIGRMKKLSAFVLLSLLSLQSPVAFAATGLPEGNYSIDPAHSKVGFEIPHLVISTVEGRFPTFEGTVTAGKKFQDTKIEAKVDVGSIDTGVKKRDEHLKSEDFFDAAKYPAMTFKSSKITGGPQSFKMEGDLTIHGVTKKVTFDSRYLGSVKDAYGNTKAAFSAKTKISRKAFGLTWGKMVEAGPVVGDEVTIDLRIQAAKAEKPAEKAAAK
jgi:polyisoprenoid-binding protein YceI